MWNKLEKLAFLKEKSSISTIGWAELHPDEKYTWLTEHLRPEFTTFFPMGTKETKIVKGINAEAIFKMYSLGVVTSRDEWIYDFNRTQLIDKTERFIRNYNSEVFRWSQEGHISSSIDGFVNNHPTFLKWTDRLKDTLKKQQMLKFEQGKVRKALYRPFCSQFLYFDHLLNQRRYQQDIIFPNSISETENVMLIVSDHGHRSPFSTLITDTIADLHVLSSTDGFQCFPYYTYTEDGSNRRENITDWALGQFQEQYGEQVTKWNIFHYAYALLHHPQYRERYAENLKRELPRIPLLNNRAAFETCVRIGKLLMELHLHYEQIAEYPLKWIENRDIPVNWRVEKMRLTPNKEAVVVNEWLTLAGIPQECFQYRLGNRSALEWVIDQYQVSIDARSGITSDPNREDEPEYIVRLMGRVVRVGVETVKLVEELAGAIKQEDWLNEQSQLNPLNS